MQKAAVAGEATAAHALRNNHSISTQTGQLHQVGTQLHLTHRACDVHGYRAVQLMEVQPGLQELQYKLYGLIELQLGHELSHAMQAGALVAHNGVSASVAGLPEGLLQLCRLAIGYIHHALALPNLSAAQVFHLVGEYHFIATFMEKQAHLVY